MASARPGGPGHIIPWASLKFLRDNDDERIVLGRGAFGTVYACEYSFMKVAVKVLEVNGRPLLSQQVNALRTEADLQASLSHEHIVRVFGLAVDDRDPAKPKCGLVMSLMHADLSSILLEASTAPSPAVLALWLPFAWRIRSILDLASGLAHLHVNGVIHSDLKPGNVMLSAPERGAITCITDFGFARVTQRLDGASGTGGGTAMSTSSIGRRGTLRYTAPELCKIPSPGQKHARPSYASDVYSWAVIAFQLLAAIPVPFPDLSDAQVVAANASDRPCTLDVDTLPQDCPEGLKELLRQCLSADPACRPRSGAELLEQLRTDLPAAATANPAVPPIMLPAHSRPSIDSQAPAPSALAQSTGGLVPEIVEWRASVVLPECPICASETVPGVKLGCGRTPSVAGSSSREHAVCLPCALRTIRLELVPDARSVRCPVCLADAADGCISEAAVSEVAAWSRMPGRTDATGALRPLSDDELARHATIVAAASRRATESVLPAGLFKRCPSCSTPISRPRGHACHHIWPGDGCPGCHQHFCYACLRLYQPGESHVRCPNGCTLFCGPSCDCPDCPDCAPGNPCDNCDDDGRCWVCQPANRPSVLAAPVVAPETRPVEPVAPPTEPVSAPADIPEPLPASPAEADRGQIERRAHRHRLVRMVDRPPNPLLHANYLATCDVCRRDIEKNPVRGLPPVATYRCIECDYDECETCFAAGPSEEGDIETNDEGAQVHVAGGHYYCGRIVGAFGYHHGLSAACLCDGRCGPRNGCNCSSCHRLDLITGRGTLPCPANDLSPVCVPTSAPPHDGPEIGRVPHEHGLVRVVCRPSIDRTDLPSPYIGTCDVCRASVAQAPGAAMYECPACEYNECLSCFADGPSRADYGVLNYDEVAVHSARGHYYCGRHVGLQGYSHGQLCGCDGQCGPTNGCNCASCARLDVSTGHEPSICRSAQSITAAARQAALQRRQAAPPAVVPAVRCSPHRHPLMRATSPYDATVGSLIAACDVCRNDVLTTSRQPWVYHCSLCDHDECESCFVRCGSTQIEISDNDDGAPVWIANGHYYCGRRVGRSGYHTDADSCRCDGRCGPADGCNCISCHRLDISSGRGDALGRVCRPTAAGLRPRSHSPQPRSTSRGRREATPPPGARAGARPSSATGGRDRATSPARPRRHPHVLAPRMLADPTVTDSCSVCRQRFRRLDIFGHCEICGYDECESCRVVTESSWVVPDVNGRQGRRVPVAQRPQPHPHRLVVMLQKPASYAGSVRCDVCRKTLTMPQQFLHCEACRYDECLACQGQTQSRLHRG